MARILLAESDRRIRRLFTGILADCGHAVEACADAVEANATLATVAIDIVVTDLVLSRGADTMLRRRCAALGIPTLTLSGCEIHPDRTPAELPPALLEKPFRFADLQGVLDAVASRSKRVLSAAAIG